jgi:hypothetical protein
MDMSTKSKTTQTTMTGTQVYTPPKESFYTNVFEPNCAYKDRCIDKGVKCNTCKHNNNRSYYEPKIYPYEPYSPYKPFTPIYFCGGYKFE